MNEDLVLLGAGKRAKTLLGIIKKEDFSSITVVDNDNSLWGSKICGYEIQKPCALNKGILWCITLKDKAGRKAIRKQCIDDLGFNKETEIAFYELIIKSYQRNTYYNPQMIEVDKRVVVFEFLPGFVLGGVETWIITLAKELIDRGKYEPYLFSKKGNYQVPYDLSESVIFVDKESELFFQPLFINALSQSLLRIKPGHIIISRPNELLLAACQMKKNTFPQMRIYIVLHNDIDELFEAYSSFWSAYGNIDYFIGVSDDVARKMTERGVPKERLLSMTCPFKCEEHIERTYSIEKEKPIQVGYAGRLDGFKGSQKRMDLLLELCIKLKRVGVSFIMNIAGEGPAKERIMEDSIQNNLVESITFWGALPHEEIERFWQRQDIAINVADYEGRCISKLEAMANGVVPIMTDTAGNRQDINDGENGYVVPLGDVDAIVENIRYLDKHRELLPIMGQKAHDSVYPKSSMDKHVAFWDALLSGKRIGNENRL